MLVVVSFATSAALLIVLNKLCLQEANVPASLATVQFFITALTARVVLQARRAAIQSFHTVWLFYIALFTISIYMNMRLLANTGVAFVIVVRSCLPISVSVLEYIYLEREFPDMQRTSTILSIALSAYAYACADIHAIRMSDACCAALYFGCLSAEMIVAKKLALSDSDPWITTYYNNMLASIPMALFATMELDKLETIVWSPRNSMLLLSSCVFAVSISVFSWQTRATLSATMYSILGVTNKFISIGVSMAIWPTSLSHVQLVIVAVGLLSGASYRSMPERKTETLLGNVSF